MPDVRPDGAHRVSSQAMTTLRRAAQTAGLVCLLTGGGASLTGCQRAVPMEAAPYATDPLCSQVLASLTTTDELAGLNRREVAAQSVAAWGDPAVELRCGVEPPGPSTEGCVQVNDVDWLGPKDPQANDRRYVTYGRTPALEVFVPVGSEAPIESVLVELGGIAATLPQDRACT